MQSKTGGKFFYGWVVVRRYFLVTMLPMVFISNFYSTISYPSAQSSGAATWSSTSPT